MIVIMLLAGQLGTQAGARILAAMPERAFEISFKPILTALALRRLW